MQFSQMTTPWGLPQTERQIATGIIRFGTAQHGGIYLNAHRVSIMPQGLRENISVEPAGDCWLEEDLAWCFAPVAFPLSFSEDERKAADQTMRDYFPSAWEAHNRRPLADSQSRHRKDQRFYDQHAESLLCVNAYGSWAKHVPEGKVGVRAKPGKYLAAFDTVHDTYWLVDRKEMEVEWPKLDTPAFVIDPAKHQQLEVVLGAAKTSKDYMPLDVINTIFADYGEIATERHTGYYPSIDALVEKVRGSKHWEMGECFVYASKPDRYLILLQIAESGCEMMVVTQNGFHDVLTASAFNQSELLKQVCAYMRDH